MANYCAIRSKSCILYAPPRSQKSAHIARALACTASAAGTGFATRSSSGTGGACIETAFFLEFSLCLSRACLGKMTILCYKKWIKTPCHPHRANAAAELIPADDLHCDCTSCRRRRRRRLGSSSSRKRRRAVNSERVLGGLQRHQSWCAAVAAGDGVGIVLAILAREVQTSCAVPEHGGGVRRDLFGKKRSFSARFSSSWETRYDGLPRHARDTHISSTMSIRKNGAIIVYHTCESGLQSHA
jgi:hypothetical protein